MPLTLALLGFKMGLNCRAYKKINSCVNNTVNKYGRECTKQDRKVLNLFQNKRELVENAVCVACACANAVWHAFYMRLLSNDLRPYVPDL